MKKIFKYKSPEEGFAFVFILLIVVLVFSITLVSGAQKFQYSTETPPVAGNPTPTATQSATPSPSQGGTPIPTTPPGGTINVVLQGCRTTKEPRMEALATVTSTTTGNIVLEVQEGTNYRQLISLSFSGGSTNYNLLLHNSLGFNTNNWRVRLVNNNNQTAIYNGNPTGC